MAAEAAAARAAAEQAAAQQAAQQAVVPAAPASVYENCSAARAAGAAPVYAGSPNTACTSTATAMGSAANSNQEDWRPGRGRK